MRFYLINPTGGMNMKKEQLIQDGYCIFEGVLDQEMLSKLTQITEQLIAKQTAEEAKRNVTTGSMIHVTSDPELAELIAYPRTLQALESLGYNEPKFSNGYIISKPPKSPRLFWHHDYACWSDPDCFGTVPQQIFLMYYLVDTYPENGCLRVIPRSHHEENPLHNLLEEAHSPNLRQVAELDNPAFMDRPDEVNVMVKAGDLVIGDSRLLHAAHENNSENRRTVITLWYHPDMKSLAEPVQAFIAKTASKIPEDWPEDATKLIEPLIPRYTGHAEPLAWNRVRPSKK
jgi:ectoine hydroxylase-related dioxygenase (phytanoyl-CoA dioxygenase family)